MVEFLIALVVDFIVLVVVTFLALWILSGTMLDPMPFWDVFCLLMVMRIAGKL